MPDRDNIIHVDFAMKERFHDEVDFALDLSTRTTYSTKSEWASITVEEILTEMRRLCMRIETKRIEKTPFKWLRTYNGPIVKERSPWTYLTT